MNASYRVGCQYYLVKCVHSRRWLFKVTGIVSVTKASVLLHASSQAQLCTCTDMTDIRLYLSFIINYGTEYYAAWTHELFRFKKLTFILNELN